MKAKLDKDGFLFVDRAGKWKAQQCPYSRDMGYVPCGDWCPLFGELDTKTICLCNDKIITIQNDGRG